MRSGSATDVPPNFWTSRGTGSNATGERARRTNPFPGKE
jgi:hypothetical protein